MPVVAVSNNIFPNYLLNVEIILIWISFIGFEVIKYEFSLML